MVTIGTDSHKRTHTFVAVDELGKRLGERTVPATETRTGQRYTVGAPPPGIGLAVLGWAAFAWWFSGYQF
jgi:hypothetical protein